MAHSAFAMLFSTGLVVGLTAASPVASAQVTPAPRLEKRATCTFSGSSGASLAKVSKTSCATIVLSNVAVPSGTTLDLTNLNDNTNVIFEGTTSFGYQEWTGPLVSVSGNQVTVTGAPGSLLDGDGSRWWDGKGSNGGKVKPHFFYAHGMTSSTISNVTIKNSPVQAFSIDGANNLHLKYITVNDKDGDTQGGHNTDAFDVGDSTGVTITGAVVYNQDDCLAVNSGTDITFQNGYCSGGHGLSIGSVGGRSDNTVQTVNILSSQVVNSANGIRVKTVSGATGSVKAVTYKNIQMSGITQYGIVIEQDYENGSPTGNPTSGVPITGLTVQGVTGSVSSSATDIYILCGKGACSNWSWSGNSVTGGKRSTSCENVPSPAAC